MMSEQTQQPLAMNIKDAAAHVGVSRDILSMAIKSGDLIAHYPTSRPVIKTSELEAWLDQTPTEKR